MKEEIRKTQARNKRYTEARRKEREEQESKSIPFLPYKKYRHQSGRPLIPLSELSHRHHHPLNGGTHERRRRLHVFRGQISGDPVDVRLLMPLTHHMSRLRSCGLLPL
jgi:hypothetical protein